MRNSLGNKVFLAVAVVLALVVQFAMVSGATAALAVKELKWAVFVPEVTIWLHHLSNSGMTSRSFRTGQ